MTVDALKVPPQSIDAEQSVLGGLLLDNQRWDVILFAERPSRIILACAPAAVERLAALAAAENVAFQVLGTTGGDKITCGTVLDVPLAEAARVWREAI